MKELTKFEQAFSLNVNEKTEKKEGLTYLSWAWAWAEFKKVYPDATYEVRQFEGKPFFADEALGYMVFTSVMAEGTTHDMWLPVMNGANKAMKAQPYSYMTRSGERTVEAATMFDINKALMRCFTKNLAMFGLGLYIYAGEDLPEVSEEVRSEAFEQVKLDTLAEVKRIIAKHKVDEALIRKSYGIFKLEDISPEQLVDLKNKLTLKYEGSDTATGSTNQD